MSSARHSPLEEAETARPHLRSFPPPCSWAERIIGTICGIPTLAAIIWVMKLIIQDTMATEKELLSRITSDTPISGFYGPGAWWAWLITLGMTNTHTSLALLKGGELPLEWDYDLIGASCYTAAAAIDLILKARTIAALGDSGSHSVLLPALLCAERVVAVGTGSLVFTVASAIRVGSSPWLHLRTAGIAIIPVVLGLAAAPFTWRAHEAICLLHNGIPEGIAGFKIFAFTDIDSPVLFLSLKDISPLKILEAYLSRDYWIIAGMSTASATCFGLVVRIARRRNLRSALIVSATVGFVSGVLFVCAPLSVAVMIALLYGMLWSGGRVSSWPVVYISAFFPRGGYFPLTGISVLEMDQMAALLAVVAVAVIRGYKSILRLKRSRNAPGDSEFHPLLPITNAGTE
ncbi:hypothetical protein DFH09DRAFT_1168574 [Mycena vulgaris]|nr:hypothetical protein DFH09DRAFT_1168574 [Mycena vulgaris]